MEVATDAPLIPYSGIKIRSNTTVTINPEEHAITLNLLRFIETIKIEKIWVIQENSIPGNNIWNGSTVLRKLSPYINGIIKEEIEKAIKTIPVKKLKHILLTLTKICARSSSDLLDKCGSKTEPMVTAKYNIIWLILAASE